MGRRALQTSKNLSAKNGVKEKYYSMGSFISSTLELFFFIHIEDIYFFSYCTFFIEEKNTAHNFLSELLFYGGRKTIAVFARNLFSLGIIFPLT